MASTSPDHAGKGPSGKPRKAARPVSAHPAFPAVVALWFAALLGLGSLVLPVALFETLVTATGLADLVPAAAPPLGFTARAGIALAGLALGAGLGLFIARKIAPPAAGQPRRRAINAAEQPRRQPLSAREELGSDSFDSVAGFASARRRALASGEEERVSDFLHVVPLPGQRHEQGFAYTEKAAPPLDLAECVQFTELQGMSPHDPSADEDDLMPKLQVFSPVSAKPEAGEPLRFSPPSMARFEAPAERDQAEFAPPAAESPAASQPETLEEPAPEPAFLEDEQDAPVRQEFMMSPAAPAEPRGATEQEAQPGLVQLVQKLGATLERHREWSAQRHEQQAESPRFPRAVFSAVLTGEDFAVAPQDEAAQAMAAFFAPEPANEPAPTVETSIEQPATFQQAEPMPTPAQSAKRLRPFAGLGQIDEGDEDEELEALAASFALPLERTTAPAAVQPAADEDEADDETSEAGREGQAYSSLLVMKNPFRDHRPEFVRVEEPDSETAAPQPAVVFPHEEAAGPARMFDRPDSVAATTASVAQMPAAVSTRPAVTSEESDRLLREALQNLQRISKPA